jgi:hypothetical protein
VLAGRSCMGSRHFALIQNVPMLALAFDLHGLANQSEGHPVAVGIDTHQIAAGDDAGDGALQPEARLASTGDELRALTLEAVDGPLVGSAVVPSYIRHRGRPFGQLRVEIALIVELAPRQEIALHVFQPPTPPGTRPIRLTQPWLEAPVLGKGQKGHIPGGPSTLAWPTHRARPVVQALAGVATKMLEGPFVGL